MGRALFTLHPFIGSVIKQSLDVQNFSTGVIVSALVGGLSLVSAQEPYSAAPAYQRRTIDEQTLNVYREELLLDKEKLLFKIQQDRFERDRKHDELLHAAYIIKSVAELDINDSEYQLKRAKILSEHAEGLDLAKDFIKQKDDLWAAQQKTSHRYAAGTMKAVYAEMAAKYHLTDADLSAIDALPPGTVRYIDSAGKIVSAEDVKGRENEFNAQFPLGRDMRTMPLAAFMTVMRLHREYKEQPQTAVAARATAPQATPTVIATDNVAAFLNSIGIRAAPLRPTAARDSSTPQK
jgi:hypothetical protein